MKSYNHLWEKFVSDENIRLAIKNSSKGKRKRRDVKNIFENQEKYIPVIREYAEHFENKKHTPKEIYDGISRKKRTIIVPSYMEQIVHHMAVNVLIPIFRSGMYEHSYASIPGRGAHKGKKFIKKWILHDTKNVKYCLKMDIKKYFDSVRHEIVKEKLKKIIHDKRFLKFLYEIIDVTEIGLPLGFYTSQWISNWFLQDLDHYIKEELGAAHYIRYMDDMVIFSSNKRELHKIKIKISEKLQEEFELRLKENWQVYRFDYLKTAKNKKGEKKRLHFGRDLDFMGFRFYRNKITLRKSILLKTKRKARKLGKKEKPTIYDIRQMLSYLGWLKATDTYNAYLEYIKPHVNIQNCKRRIARHDRRRNKKNVEISGKQRYREAA